MSATIKVEEEDRSRPRTPSPTRPARPTSPTRPSSPTGSSSLTGPTSLGWPATPSLARFQTPAQQIISPSRVTIPDSQDDPADRISPGPDDDQQQQRLPRAREVTRDEKIVIRALAEHTEYTHFEIAIKLNHTIRQVQRAIGGALTPRKARPRRSFLPEEMKDQLLSFLNEDEAHRKIAWQDLRYFVPGFEGIGFEALSRALRDLGYVRRRQPRHPLSNPAIRQARVDMSELLLSERPEPQDWLDFPMCFYDETWATTAVNGLQWITVHELEDPASFHLLRRQRGPGWMFCGAVCGRKKAFSKVWEKGWGGINQYNYQDHVLPAIRDFIRQQPTHVPFVHDNAPAHRAASTRAWLHYSQMEVVKWAAYSPDLNLIENVWSWMKSWLTQNYDITRLSLAQLREAVAAAWEAVPEDFLASLALSMPRRLQQVIDRQGGLSDY